MNNLLNHLTTMVPDGSYVGEITNVVIDQLPGGGEKIGFELELDGDGSKLCANKMHKVNTKKSANFLKKELATIGLRVKDGKEFATIAPGLAGTRIMVDAVTNDQGFQSYYFKGLADQKKDISEEIGW